MFRQKYLQLRLGSKFGATLIFFGKNGKHNRTSDIANTQPTKANKYDEVGLLVIGKLLNIECTVEYPKFMLRFITKMRIKSLLAKAGLSRAGVG